MPDGAFARVWALYPALWPELPRPSVTLTLSGPRPAQPGVYPSFAPAPGFTVCAFCPELLSIPKGCTLRAFWLKLPEIAALPRHLARSDNPHVWTRLRNEPL